MKTSRLLLVGLLVAILALCLFLFRETPAPPMLVADDSGDRSSSVAEKDEQLEIPKDAPAAVAEPPPQASASEPTGPVLPAVSSALLHIVDEQTGAALDGISLYRVSPLDRPPIFFPSKLQLSDCVGTEIAAPTRMIRVDRNPATGGPTGYLACNRDHAWGQISVDTTAGVDFVLRLKPGGTLRVTWMNDEPNPKLKWTLWRTDAPRPELLAEWPLSAPGPGQYPTLDLVGLQTGPYRVCAELAAGLQPQVLASRDFSIRAGERADVALSAGKANPRRDKLRVIVKLDPEWQLDKFKVDVRAPGVLDGTPSKDLSIPSSEMKRPDTDREYYISDLFSVDPGMVHFTIPEALFDLGVMIGADRKKQVMLEVPEPGRVVVDVLYDATGSIVADARLEWLPQDFGAPHFAFAARQIAEIVPGRFEFRAPQGEFGLFAQSRGNPDYVAKAQSVHIGDGTNPVTIRLARSWRMILTLREGEQVVPWPVDRQSVAVIESVDGDKRSPSIRLDEGSKLHNFHFAAPGSYQLRLRKIPGYKEVPPFQFEIGLFNTTEIAIQLERE